jgi:5-methylcytosine-specific restriction endonuclease McrA
MGPWSHLYKTPEWEALRQAHFKADPRNRFCSMCLEARVRRRANIVDHIKPHHGKRELFFDPRNLQTLCPTHHNRFKRREEHGRILSGCDADGIPTNPKHPWRR